MSPASPSPALMRGILALVLVAVFLARLATAGVAPLADEAFLTLRYAANLEGGHGLVVHPGAPWQPVLGITSPGQAVLLAGLGLAGARGVLILALVADLVSAALVVSLLRRRPAAALGAGLALALLPGLVWPSMAGHSGPLLLALVLGALVSARDGRFARAGVALGLALTLRPEAALVVPGLLANPRGRRDRWLALLVPIALLAALYLGTLRGVYGSPVPAPVVAGLRSGEPYARALGALLAGALAPHPVHLPVTVLGIWGALALVRERSPLAPLVWGAILVLVVWLCLAPAVSEAGQVLPRAVLALGAGRALALPVEQAVEWARRALGARLPALAPLSAVALAALVGASVLGLRRGVEQDGRELWDRVWAPMAAWAEEAHLEERGATLLASDAGTVGWFVGGHVLDREGLTWRPGLRYGSFLERILHLAPEYLLLQARRAELGTLRSVDDLSRAYYPIRRFSLKGETELEPELADLAEGEVADYLLFRRRQ